MADKTTVQKRKVDSGSHAAKESASRQNAPSKLPVSSQLPGLLQRALLTPESLDHDDLSAVQSVVGMRATRRVLAGLNQNRQLTVQRKTDARASLQQLMANRGFIVQPKLTVGAANDPYEQEADRVARQVMSSPAPVGVEDAQPDEETISGIRHGGDTSMQTDDAELEQQATTESEHEEDEEEEVVTPAIQDTGGTVRRMARAFTPHLYRKADLPSITPLVQRYAPDLSGSFDAGRAIEQQLSANTSGGSPMPAKLRSELEPKFGADFSNVRVHTGAQSDQLNRSLGAQAFTHSNHIYMASGKFNPGTGAGKSLLAHELTHVVQQTGAKPLEVQTKRLSNDARRPVAERVRKISSPDCIRKKNKKPPKAPTPVPTMTHKTTFSAPDGTSDDRTTVAVGEKVTFTGSAKGKWSCTTGKPWFKLTKSTSFVWKAPKRAGSADIKLKVADQEAKVKMTVVEPNQIIATKLSDMNFPSGQAAAGMKLKFNYHPMNVSFGNIQAMEVSGPATGITGYYAKHYKAKQLKHDSGDTFFGVGDDNVDSSTDTASTEDSDTPYENGTFQWIIPNRFRLKGEWGKGKKFTDVTQAFKIDPTGTITVTKAGQSVVRSP